MRAVDDIKESVRKAALSAWRALSSVINRLCDGTLAPAAQAEEVLSLVLPTLLELGISHSSDDVRALCTKQVNRDRAWSVDRHATALPCRH